VSEIVKLDGVEVESPVNFDELSIDIQFDKDKTEVSVSINEWEFAEEHKDILNAHRAAYLFEGLPMTIDPTGEGIRAELLEFLLEVKSANPISCDRETIPAIALIDRVKRNRHFTFEYLFEGLNYPHNRFNFIPVPYTKNAPADAEIMLAFISAAFVIIEVQNLVDELIDKIVNSSSFEWGEWIASIPFFIKAILVSTASIQILLMLYNLIVQPIKYHMAMRVFDMFTVGYSFLGYDFKSTAFSTDPLYNLALLPRKFQVPTNTDQKNNLLLDILGIDFGVLKGFTDIDIDEQTAYYSGTFDELVESFKSGYNLKEIIEPPTVAGENPTIRLERRDYNTSADKITIDPIDIEEHTLNTEDFTSNYTVLLAVDATDINTLTHYKGTSCTEHVYPTTWKNKQNLLVGGLTKVQLQFAKGVRKTEFNKQEKILDKLFKAAAPIVNEFVFQHNVKLKQAITVVSTVVDIINTTIDAANSLPGVSIKNIVLKGGIFKDVPFITVPDLSTLIGDRIGMLMLESDEFEVDKLILMEDNFQLQNTVTADPAYLLAPKFFDLFNPNNLEDLKGVDSSGDSPRANKLDDRNDDIVNAEWIYKNYHSIESFVPNVNGVTDWNNGKHNQYIKYDTSKFTFCNSDYKKAISTNKLNWCGKEGEFFGPLNWSVKDKIAQGNFKINEIYYRNLRSNLIVPNGSTRTK